MGLEDRENNLVESYPLKSIDMSGAKYSVRVEDPGAGMKTDGGGTKAGRHQDESWSRVWYDFSQRTTLHGINNITGETPFPARRILWFLIVLLGLTLFGKQMVESVTYYLQHPVTVNVKINYNTTLTFPAVTICNQNDFRMTATADRDLYHMVQEYYLHMNKKQIDLSKYGTANLSLADLYQWAAHRKEDMIISCLWDETECNATDFTETLTDYGMCYTFNRDDGQTKLRTVERTGADRGLRLRLNIEQYEYMLGPNPGAGIKILIHENKEVPLVRDLGQAIPPGTHAYVAVQITEVKNLKRPHGICNDSVQLTFFPYYSIPSCIVDCKERFLLERCECRDVYMPEPPEGEQSREVCTLDRYQTCALPMIEKEFYQPREDGSQRCVCPIPCLRRLFDPTISYAHTSSYDAEQFLMSDNFRTVQQRFLEARDVFQHVDHTVRQRDVELLTSFNSSISNIATLMSELEHGIARFHEEILQIEYDIKERAKFHERWGVEKVRFTVHHDFTRGWDVMNERTFELLTANFMEMTALIGRIFELASESDAGDKSYHQTLYVSAEHDLYQKKVLCARAFDNLTTVRDGYVTGKRLLTYKASPRRRYDETWVPNSIVIPDDKYITGFAEKLITRTREYCKQIDNVRNLTLEILTGGQANMTKYKELRDRLEAAGRSYNYYRFRFYDNIVLNPEKAADTLVENFRHVNKSMFSEMNYLSLAVVDFENFLVTVMPAWQRMLEIKDTVSDYLQNRKSKIDLAESLISKSATENRQTLVVFFEEARLRARHIGDLLNRVRLALSALWRKMVDEPSTTPFYKMVYDDVTDSVNNDTVLQDLAGVFAYMLNTNRTWIMNNTDQLYRKMNADFSVTTGEIKTREVEETFAELESMIDITYVIKDSDAIFLRAFDRLQEDLRIFSQGNKMDDEFFKDNFMSVDVFMKELSYEEIQQQVAYDLTSLWSDIGGSMGLFIGASVLTVFEVADVIVHNVMKIYCLGTRRGT